MRRASIAAFSLALLFVALAAPAFAQEPAPAPQSLFVSLTHEDGTVIFEASESPVASFSRSLRSEGVEYTLEVAVGARSATGTIRRGDVVVHRFAHDLNSVCSHAIDAVSRLRFVVGIGSTAADALAPCGNGDASPPGHTRRTAVVREYIRLLALGSPDEAYAFIDPTLLSRADWSRDATPGQWGAFFVGGMWDTPAPSGGSGSAGQATVRVSLCLQERRSQVWHAYEDAVPVVVSEHRFRLARPAGPRAGRAPESIGDDCPFAPRPPSAPRAYEPGDEPPEDGFISGGVAIEAAPLHAPPPRPRVSIPEPVYPADARARGIEGRVRVFIEVAADGTLTSARVRGGDAVFVAAALAAVRRGRFEAARDAHGQPVASSTTVVVVFRLDE